MKENFDKFDKYENYLTSYSTTQIGLESIVKNEEVIFKINDIVIIVKKIKRHTFSFLKMYTLHSYNTVGNIPTINIELIKGIMKTISKKDNRGKKGSIEIKELFNSLQKFYKEHYEPIMNEKEELILTHLNTLLDYEAISILTAIENHIKNNFYDFFNRYVNIMIDKSGMERYIKYKKDIKDKDDILRNYRNEVNRLKKDILKHKDKCFEEFNEIKTYIRNTFFINIDKQKNIITQVKDDPIKFLLTLIKMNIEIENRNKKIFSCFPLGKSIIPKHVKIDTTTIIHTLFTKNMNKAYFLNDGNTLFYREYIWSLFFRTERKFFNRKNYIFDNQITTDGISCSILLLRKDLYKKDKRNKIKAMKKPFGYKEEKYIDQINDDEKKKYKNYTLVGIDPNKDDLIYCSTIKGEKNGRYDIETFRYTQNQRRKETKSKKYKQILENDKKNTYIIKELKENELKKLDRCNNINDFLNMYKKHKYINDYENILINKIKKCNNIKELCNIFNNFKTRKKEINKCKTVEDINKNIYNPEGYNINVKELETVLSKYNSKSCKYQKVVEYIKVKNKINTILDSYYNKKIHRKLKWYTKINKKRSEARMINKFKEKFGDESKVLICFGDYEQRKQMKYKEPSKGKSFRKLFKKAGYKLYLVDEYNTSKMNFYTGQENKKFMKRKNPRPWKKDIIEVHGLLRSKNDNKSKPTEWIMVNRDLNASLNIREKAKSIILNKPIPIQLKRT